MGVISAARVSKPNGNPACFARDISSELARRRSPFPLSIEHRSRYQMRLRVRCQVWGQKRMSSGCEGMSVWCRQQRTHAPQQNESLFDHVISAGEKRRWNRYTNRLSGPEIDKKLRFRGLLNRKIGGVYPFEDLVDERACASVQGRHVRSIKPASHCSLANPMVGSRLSKTNSARRFRCT